MMFPCPLLALLLYVRRHGGNVFAGGGNLKLEVKFQRFVVVMCIVTLVVSHSCFGVL